MCGIFGTTITQSIYKKSVLNHRGPDAYGEYKNDFIYLAHNRLSILDLDSHANQPFNFKHYIIVFNGEIFNFKNIKKELKKNGYMFETTSDTEALIKAFDFYKEKVVDYLNGDFSFCIYNNKTNKLFCARDRVGNKPFYYSFKNNNFIFSSEIHSFKKYFNLEFNEQKLCDSVLFSLNDNEEQTIYKDIFNLPPASTLSLDINSLKYKIKKYWS